MWIDNTTICVSSVKHFLKYAKKASAVYLDVIQRMSSENMNVCKHYCVNVNKLFCISLVVEISRSYSDISVFFR